MTPMFQIIGKVRIMRNFVLFVCALTLLVAGATAASAQEITSTLRGMVVDQQNKPLTGISVTALDVDRHITMNVRTDNQGNFNFVGLGAGRIQVSIDAPGYTALTSTPFRIGNHESGRVSFRTKTEGKGGDITYQLLPFQADSSQVSTSIDGDALAALPRH